MEVEFSRDYYEDELPIAKWLQTSKYRFAHTVKADSEEDITTQLTEWIKRSYELIRS